MTEQQQPRTRREMRELRERQAREEAARERQQQRAEEAEAQPEPDSATEPEPAPQPKARRQADTPVDAPSQMSGRVPRVRAEQIQQGNYEPPADQDVHTEDTPTGMLPSNMPIPAPVDTSNASSRREARAMRARAYAAELQRQEDELDLNPAQAGTPGEVFFNTQMQDETDQVAVVSAADAGDVKDPTGLNTALDTTGIERAQLEKEIAQLQEEIVAMGQANPNVIDTKLLSRQQELAAKMAELKKREAAAVVTEEEFQAATGQVPQFPAESVQQTLEDPVAESTVEEPEAPVIRQEAAPTAAQPKLSERDMSAVEVTSAHGLDPLDAKESSAADNRSTLISNIVLFIGVALIIVALWIIFVG